ncbi:triose-phosphate isomerase [Hahella sp. CCB-MM4]|uniref:triose-phosphate isomerase n=1 Tax=Hahella sp. (strain CCB-MM4) TaxID=1926491 RepID=UPI000B9A7771|nr:triose-phosphate isomerase [Hahella sp. CCB-MM4]OZG71700.1 triose-phosphate isomerase [Hahella sp. CCB-MM4]
MRSKLVAGNWKSNGSLVSNKSLLSALKECSFGPDVNVLVSPPAVYLAGVANDLQGSKIEVGAQNCSAHDSGAFTGEVTAEMLKEVGASWVVLGHSERRAIFGESDSDVAAKVKKALNADLRPIVCVGETLEEREAGRAEDVCVSQLDGAMAEVKADERWVIAYEPVWAIGTGKTASAEDAQAMHKVLRNRLREVCGDVADRIQILYGGSVKASNASELFQQQDIDGALVGGASLKAEEFAAIIAAAGN